MKKIILCAFALVLFAGTSISTVQANASKATFTKIAGEDDKKDKKKKKKDAAAAQEANKKSGATTDGKVEEKGCCKKGESGKPSCTKK